MDSAATRPLVAFDVMTSNPISIRANATPRDLARILTEREISGVPVVDETNLVIGVVSKSDLLQWCVRGGLGFGASNLLLSLAEGGDGTRLEAVDLGIVADFMTCKPVTAEAGESLANIARRMAENRVHRVIIVDTRGHLQGIVTSMDLLRVFPDHAHLAAA
jgi:CBS domain-containing protein